MTGPLSGWEEMMRAGAQEIPSTYRQTMYSPFEDMLEKLQRQRDERPKRVYLTLRKIGLQDSRPECGSRYNPDGYRTSGFVETVGGEKYYGMMSIPPGEYLWLPPVDVITKQWVADGVVEAVADGEYEVLKEFDCRKDQIKGFKAKEHMSFTTRINPITGDKMVDAVGITIEEGGGDATAMPGDVVILPAAPHTATLLLDKHIKEVGHDE